MKKLFLLLSVCALACSTSGTPPPTYPAEPVEPDTSGGAAPPEVAAAPDQPAAANGAGNAETCSAVCDRVASCQLASKEKCMPVCTPQLPQLTAEQQAQVIPTIASLPCDELTQFGAQSGGGAPAAAPPAAPEAEQVGDGQGS